MIPLILAIPAFIIGIIFLYKGSDILVDGTSKTAAQLGISVIIISVILVAFGTSAPELSISVGAAIGNHPEISFGNVVGSCVANLLLVLGISAIIRPIKIKKSVLKREMPVIVIITIILLLAAILGLLDTYRLLGGILFIVLFIAFIAYFIHCGKKERVAKKYGTGSLYKNILFIVLGIIGVVAGAWLLIESAIQIAEFLGIPELIIAISIVAIGTSLPELVVSAMAAYKDKHDIAIGNVLGSNVFNILLILGAAALLIPLNAMASIDHLLLLVGVTLVMFPILSTGEGISRRKGVILLILYSFFILYIFWLQDVVHQTL